MKEFIKFTFATVTGLVLTLAVLTILSIVTITGIIASSDTETNVKSNSIFVLDFNGQLLERSNDNPINDLLYDNVDVYGLDDVLSSIKKAKENDDIKGIYLTSSFLSTSFASLEEIRNALLDFKKSKKFIVAYADQYTQGMYYLASVSDKVFVNPQGTISWHGLASEPVFYKDLLNKLGIEMQVFKVGTYKSAVEPYTSTTMSDANREQVTAYLNSIWGKLLSDISASRKISVDSLNSYADQIMDLKPAKEYVKCHLADELMYKDGVLKYLKKLTDRKDDESLRTLYLSDMINVKKNVPKDKSGNVIAVYYAYGEIANSSATSMSEGIIDGEKVIKDLRGLRDDDDVKAVVLRVNSPGGSAFASEQIWHEVVSLKEKKPVIVSMGDYAASGGYYISCGASYIVADPTTITGSIGIFGMFPNMQGLLTDKLGLHFSVVKTNKFSDMGTVSRPFNADEKEAFQQYINNGYSLFVKRCADGRNKSVEDIEKIAQGRVWTGEMAKGLGLVDELGGIDKAISIAASRAKIKNYTLLSYPEKGNWLTQLLNKKKDSYIDGKLKESFGEYYNGLKFIQNLKDADNIQARLPFELNIK